MSLTLNGLLKDSAYKLTQFNADKIQTLESSIIVRETRGKATPYVNCLVRNKEIKLTPEEAIRQLSIMSLKDDLGYPASRMELEYGVTFGREKKRADICIFDKNRPTVPYILVELKKPKLKDGKEQLKSYCNATGAPMGIWRANRFLTITAKTPIILKTSRPFQGRAKNCPTQSSTIDRYKKFARQLFCRTSDARNG